MCLKELMLIKQMVPVSVLFVITGTFLNVIFYLSQKKDLTQDATSFNDLEIVSIKEND